MISGRSPDPLVGECPVKGEPRASAGGVPGRVVQWVWNSTGQAACAFGSAADFCAEPSPMLLQIMKVDVADPFPGVDCVMTVVHL